MDLAVAVAAALTAAGEAFGPPPAAAPAPRWGELYVELDAAADAEFATAIELIYEGYLLHYRESRAVTVPAGDRETRLLAGDFFYARGLRSIAARGDAHAVGLLARLMAACSYLRAVEAPFAADDSLWAFATAGLAAQHGGTPPGVAAALFDEVDAGFHSPSSADVPAAAGRAAGRLGLRDPRPLERALAAAGAPSAGSASPAAVPTAVDTGR